MGDQFQLLFALDAGNLEGFIGLPGAAGMIARLETEDVFWEYLQLTERDFSDEEGRTADPAFIPRAVRRRIMDGDAENGRNLKHREQNRREQNARERIIVTDRSALAQALTENEICVIGFQHGAEAGSFFQGTELVLFSFEDLDAVFFRNVLKHFHHLPVYIAETERLVLRESIAEDFDAIFRMSRELTPDATTDAFSGDPEAEREKFLRYIQYAYSFFGFGLWTVLERQSGAVIGRCGLMPAADRRTPEGRVELGYLIAREMRGKGYALEACRAVLDFAFRELECGEIYAGIGGGNTESIRLARRLGFSREDDPGEAGSGYSTDLWKLTAEEYEKESC